MIALFAAAALAQATPSATPPAPLPTPAPAAASVHSSAADKVICKSLPQTGSLFAGPKECHRKSEWDAINAASRDDLNDYQQRTNQGSAPPR